MSSTIKIKDAGLTVKDKLGWGRVNPFIAIWFIDEETRSTSISTDGLGSYVKQSNYRSIEYKGNYWPTHEEQLKGLESRPLAHFVEVEDEAVYEINSEGEYSLDDSGEKIPTGEIIPAHKVWTDKFTVDMKHPESMGVINSSLIGDDEINSLIDLSVKRDFK